MEIAELDRIIAEPLGEFYREVLSSPWCGREHEMVSLFVLGYLARHCSPNGLFRLTQIGIDVGVKQLKEPKPGNKKGPTKTVQKDVVVWSEPNETLWTPDGQVLNKPLAVMEWKVIHQFNKDSLKKLKGEYDYDKRWLERTANRIGANFVGYAVLANTASALRTLTCARIESTNCEAKDWIVLNGEL
jgi:hypothetical protein